MPTTEPATLGPGEVAAVEAAHRPAKVGSLYSILDELVELAALADEPDLADDERLAVHEQIAKYVGAEIAGRKVDGIAATIRECKARAAVADEEAKRLAKRAASWLGRVDRIEASTLRAMQDHGVTKLETPTNRLRIQANGGKEPLDVYAPADVPESLCRFTLRLTGAERRLLAGAVGLVADKGVRDELVRLLFAPAPEPDGEAIRAALKSRTVCPACGGLDVKFNGCERCATAGFAPAEVPGARLLPRGVHLRVE